MKEEVIIIGSGIEGLMTAFKLLNSFKVIIYTSASDPRKISKNKFNLYADSKKLDGATWVGGFMRHISSVEGNSFLKEEHKLDISTHIKHGGWIGKDTINNDEKLWLKKRKIACDYKALHKELQHFYQQLNLEGVNGWNEILRSHSFLFKNTNYKPGIKVVMSKPECTEEKSDRLGFSIDIQAFCMNLISYLEESGVKIFFIANVTYHI